MEKLIEISHKKEELVLIIRALEKLKNGIMTPTIEADRAADLERQLRSVLRANL